MLRQKGAPVARTPPTLPQIPGITKELDQKQVEREHEVIEEATEENGSGDKAKAQADSVQNQSFQDENEDENEDEELDMEL